MQDTPLNNAEIARRIGVSRAAVSRFRGGSRAPRLETRRRIAEAYAWPIPDQAQAEATGTYGEKFTERLCAALEPASP